jgi:hypothetical protein
MAILFHIKDLAVLFLLPLRELPRQHRQTCWISSWNKDGIRKDQKFLVMKNTTLPGRNSRQFRTDVFSFIALFSKSFADAVLILT